MARGENPGNLLMIDTSLTYDATKDFGHASAGKDLALTLHRTGTNIGKAQLAADGEKILGTFLSLDKDKVATYMADGKPMLLRKASGTILFGVSLVGAGSGQVKSTPTTETAETAERGRGQVIKILESGANGRILALMP